MRRRSVLKGVLLSVFFGSTESLQANITSLHTPSSFSDRKYWVDLISRIASPILENISKGQLKVKMPKVYSPTFDNRDRNVMYLEAFGRLLAGMAPWFNLPNDNSEEGVLRSKLCRQALLGIKNGVDPESPDYFLWRGDSTKQPLVDAAHLAQAFLRAPQALWDPLSRETKQRVVLLFKGLRKVTPNESNWLLFAAIPEAFLHHIGEDCDRSRIDYAVNKFDKEWYVGDGWYSDGPHFSFDHYNGYVIHCMLVETLAAVRSADVKYQEMYDRAYKRMQRYAHHLERMISPEGFPLIVGRSSTYRNAAFQPLALVALDGRLPKDLSKGQVRAALTSVLKHIFVEKTFDKEGWLTLGVVGDRQSDVADYYTNLGSMYVASLSFLPLGLPATDEFWTCKPEKWTSQKIWEGLPFPKDYYVNY